MQTNFRLSQYTVYPPPRTGVFKPIRTDGTFEGWLEKIATKIKKHQYQKSSFVGFAKVPFLQGLTVPSDFGSQNKGSWGVTVKNPNLIFFLARAHFARAARHARYHTICNAARAVGARASASAPIDTKSQMEPFLYFQYIHIFKTRRDESI